MLAANEFHNRDDLFSYLTEAYGRRGTPSLHCFPFFVDEDFGLLEALELAIRKGLRTTINPISDDLILVGIGVRTSYELGYMFPVDGSWVYASDGRTASLKSTLGAFARSMSHVLRLAYVPSETLLQTVEGIRRNYSAVVATEGTIRTKGQTFRNWKREPVEFSAKRLGQLASREGGKWTGISFKCVTAGTEIISSRVYERGHLTLYSGNFPGFYSDILLPYLSASIAVRDGLQGLERLDRNGEVVLRPVRFDLSSPISPAEREILKTSILKKYVAAVTHPGNPMLIMNLSDAADGSVYDLYAYGNKVEVVPQQKASPGSVTELVSLVSDIFPTGTTSVV